MASGFLAVEISGLGRIYTCTYVYVYVYMHTDIHIYIYVCMSVCMYIYIYTYLLISLSMPITRRVLFQLQAAFQRSSYGPMRSRSARSVGER